MGMEYDLGPCTAWKITIYKHVARMTMVQIKEENKQSQTCEIWIPFSQYALFLHSVHNSYKPYSTHDTEIKNII